MNRRLIRGCILGSFLFLSALQCLYAETVNRSWAEWLQNQVYRNPEIIAAKEKMNAQLSLAEGRQSPIYNPELASDIEREGSKNNYRLGIRQTIDWWGKRDTRKQQSEYSRRVAIQSYEFIIQQKIGESLQTLIEWQSANKKSKLALAQEVQMETMISLITRRQVAGDLGLLDTELALLNFSQKINNTAHAQVRLRQSEVKLRELLPEWSTQQVAISEDFFSLDLPHSNRLVDKHPVVMAAKAEWKVMRKLARLVKLQSKPEPTFGINAGKEGDDNIIGISFSMPLAVRNDFSHEVRAANQNALSAEAQYRSVRRKQQLLIESSQQTLSEFRQRFERLKRLMRGRDERSKKLLKKQWSSGDMSTTEYLLALQQRTEGLVAGIELKTQFQLAHINWLLQSGQLIAALKQL